MAEPDSQPTDKQAEELDFVRKLISADRELAAIRRLECHMRLTCLSGVLVVLLMLWALSQTAQFMIPIFPGRPFFLVVALLLFLGMLRKNPVAYGVVLALAIPSFLWIAFFFFFGVTMGGGDIFSIQSVMTLATPVLLLWGVWEGMTASIQYHKLLKEQQASARDATE